jgi:hypothetical protein
MLATFSHQTGKYEDHKIEGNQHHEVEYGSWDNFIRCVTTTLRLWYCVVWWVDSDIPREPLVCTLSLYGVCRFL